ncbi:MAG: type II/IV secretion system protein [Planctomycetes bacterium]|nr:type II/IV secretion system protein [Planctomycetota bacterium]
MAAIPSLRTFALVVAVGLLTPGLLLAAPPFPRGTGFYYDPYKLVTLVVSFFCWVKLCAWVDTDTHQYKIPSVFWNGILLAAGAGGFLVTWVIGIFWVTMVLSWGLVSGLAYWYVTVRNRRAPADERLLDKHHFLRLYEKYLTRSKKDADDDDVKAEGHPIRFMSRSATGESEDTRQVERVQQSKGYKAALEMVWNAIKKRATDIHLEPTANDIPVRFRIDGMMTNVKPFTRAMGDAVINIFKVLCNLDITEKRKPQDGSFSAQVEDRIVEFRVATAGSVVGEKLVMRVLDATAQLADLGQVGLTESLQAEVRDVISKPHGLFLVVGPTGSGKSTTLYACLHEIDRFAQNVITVENPVEYRLEGVTQIEVNPKAGKTFASELRSILRQDPDVILIGEIRDKETAEIACQAAQTGHLVFSTLHANDSVTAIARMIDLGTPPFMLSSALMGVLSQRLVRKLCKKCRKRVKPSNETLKKLKVDSDAVRYLYRAFDPVEDVPKKDDEDDDEPEVKVCQACGGTGYLKRTGIFDLLIITDKIRELIKANPNVQDIRQVAIDSGMKSLFEDGARLVVEGDTSIQELLRVSK